MSQQKLKILFCGFRHGHINGLYKKVLASDLAEVAGCFESNDEARATAEQKLGAVFAKKSYEEWLATDVDVVAIGGAYGDRGQAVIQALRAGKHIIADKPLCTRLEELAEIRRLSEEKNLKISCMLDLRYLPQSKAAKELLDSGRLGEIRNISFTGQHCIDYAHRPTWYFEEGMHGGTVNDLSIHGVDLVRMLSGQDFAKIDAVRTWNSYADRHKNFRDCALLMARLENGAGVLADVSYSAPSQVFSMPTYWEFRVWCARGLLSFSLNDPELTVYEEGNKDPIRISCPATDWDYLCELADAIKQGNRAATENVLCSTETALTLQRAAEREEMQ